MLIYKYLQTERTGRAVCKGKSGNGETI